MPKTIRDRSEKPYHPVSTWEVTIKFPGITETKVVLGLAEIVAFLQHTSTYGIEPTSIETRKLG